MRNTNFKTIVHLTCDSRWGKQKLVAIDVKESKWTTYHGLALNITMDIKPFRQIIQCGIRVGGLKELLNENVQYQGCREEFNHHTDDPKLFDCHSWMLMKISCEVFEVECVMPGTSGVKSLSPTIM